jgi:antitoxin component of RelBE/YafQ-DinJ toxin-antitoxin module
MDLTISLPAEVSEKARKLADEMGLSIDQFLTLVIRHYVNDHPAEMITETLDAVYENELSAMDPLLSKLQSISIAREEW